MARPVRSAKQFQVDVELEQNIFSPDKRDWRAPGGWKQRTAGGFSFRAHYYVKTGPKVHSDLRITNYELRIFGSRTGLVAGRCIKPQRREGRRAAPTKNKRGQTAEYAEKAICTRTENLRRLRKLLQHENLIAVCEQIGLLQRRGEGTHFGITIYDFGTSEG